jgi:subtilisin-like proprotein convertase family protein
MNLYLPWKIFLSTWIRRFKMSLVGQQKCWLRLIFLEEFMRILGLLALSAVAGAASATVYNGGGGEITDLGTLTLNINVGASHSAVNGVRLVRLSHTWVGDVIVTLTAPDGDTASIVSRIGSDGTTVGDSSNFDGTYNFIPGGADIWAEAANGAGSYVLASGDYAPSGVGSGADTGYGSIGAQNAGTWTLTITDNAAGDVGLLGAWELDLKDDAVVPEPASMIALGAGLAAFAARRRRK